MAVGLLSLCLDHHKFSIKTNLRAFNSKRFTRTAKAKDCKDYYDHLDFLIGTEGASNERIAAAATTTATTEGIAIDLQLMSTTLHCIYTCYASHNY